MVQKIEDLLRSLEYDREGGKTRSEEELAAHGMLGMVLIAEVVGFVWLIWWLCQRV